MKKVEVYGVMVTPLQEMLIMKYINTNGITMNTKTKEERKEVVLSFLNSLC